MSLENPGSINTSEITPDSGEENAPSSYFTEDRTVDIMRGYRQQTDELLNGEASSGGLQNDMLDRQSFARDTIALAEKKGELSAVEEFRAFFNEEDARYREAAADIKGQNERFEKMQQEWQLDNFIKEERERFKRESERGFETVNTRPPGESINLSAMPTPEELAHFVTYATAADSYRSNDLVLTVPGDNGKPMYITINKKGEVRYEQQA